MNSVAQSVYDYWFGTDGLSLAAIKGRSALWWKGSADIDYDIERRFGKLVEAAGKGAFADWAYSAQGALALIILNDQFPRNLYRASGKAFSHDALARKYASQLVQSGLFEALVPIEKTFALLPFEHSEALIDQTFCAAQFALLVETADPEWLATMQGYHHYALDHKKIIEEFGRFPHRNKALGRESTPQESAYLQAGARTFGQ